MPDINSRRPVAGRQDAEARSLIERNRGTIERLADQISGGGYSASRRAAAAPTEPAAAGLIISDLGARRVAEEPKPYVRISPNRRVVVVDETTSRQMHHLGEIRRVEGRPTFVLATRANGFFSAVDADIAGRLAPLDGAPLQGERSEAALTGEIAALLGYV